tara:strand:- start:2042 stop:2713 length:672 start_codon:yes stop_codon:yes gene_type:complete
MKLGDYLLSKGYINKKQLNEALAEQSQQAINYNKPVQIGKVLIEKGFVTVDEISEALNGQMLKGKEEKTMATEIGEGSKFTFDLKFMATMATILVSACATYFSIMGSINDLKEANSPSRLEYSYLKDKVESIESNGDLKLITYQLEEFKVTFDEIKTLASQLSPLASDLDFIKVEINKLKNKTMPEVDLSVIETKLDNLSNSLNSFEKRVSQLEKRKQTGGRF